MLHQQGTFSLNTNRTKKNTGKRRGKKAPQSNIQTSIIVVQVTPKSKSISLLFMSLLIQLFIQYEVRNQEWKRTKMEWERERGKGSEDKNEATAMMIMIKETNVWPFFQFNRAQTPFHKIIVAATIFPENAMRTPYGMCQLKETSRRMSTKSMISFL